VEALIGPTTPSVAVVQGPEASSAETFGRFIRNTDPGSNAGLPGLSLFAGMTPGGLPVGLEIDGRASVVRLQVEDAHPIGRRERLHQCAVPVLLDVELELEFRVQREIWVDLRPRRGPAARALPKRWHRPDSGRESGAHSC